MHLTKEEIKELPNNIDTPQETSMSLTGRAKLAEQLKRDMAEWERNNKVQVITMGRTGYKNDSFNNVRISKIKKANKRRGRGIQINSK
jgi:hypothetical protein